MSLSNVRFPSYHNVKPNSVTINLSDSNPGDSRTLWVDSASGHLFFGSTDLQALKGDTGDTGTKGEQGVEGVKGEKGEA